MLILTQLSFCISICSALEEQELQFSLAGKSIPVQGLRKNVVCWNVGCKLGGCRLVGFLFCVGRYVVGRLYVSSYVSLVQA